MSWPIYATYDGEVLHPEGRLPVEPGRRVRIIVVDEVKGSLRDAPPYSFLDVVQSLNLDGPSDLSTNLDAYLYGRKEWPGPESDSDRGEPNEGRCDAG